MHYRTIMNLNLMIFIYSCFMWKVRRILQCSTTFYKGVNAYIYAIIFQVFTISWNTFLLIYARENWWLTERQMIRTHYPLFLKHRCLHKMWHDLYSTLKQSRHQCQQEDNRIYITTKCWFLPFLVCKQSEEKCEEWRSLRGNVWHLRIYKIAIGKMVN